MKYYYYAHSGHKHGLDRVRRAVALIKAFATVGIEVELLVNDFRAGLAAKELGVQKSLTIETFLDIDAVAVRGDVLFIDTHEEFDSKIKEFVELFDTLYRIVDDCQRESLYGEVLIAPMCKDGKECLSATLIDTPYFEENSKKQRVLFFFGDADYNKELLAHREFFAGLDMELLLGEYFFVKYENELAKIFTTLYEGEEYMELITHSSTIVTASMQTAFEAKASGAHVIYMKRAEDADCLLQFMSQNKIKFINYFDKDELINILSLDDNREKILIEGNISNKQQLVKFNL